MMTTVENIMSTAVVCAKPGDSVLVLERLMEKMDIQCLPIINNACQCIGVISATELARLHNVKRWVGGEVQASEICSQPVIEVEPNLSIMEAVKLMLSNNIHHLIVSENDQLIGILSSMDILEKYVLKKSGSLKNNKVAGK